jgi:hypothetical protein
MDAAKPSLPPPMSSSLHTISYSVAATYWQLDLGQPGKAGPSMLG